MISIILRKAFIIVFLCVSYNVKAQEYKAGNFGKGLFYLEGENNSWAMKIGLRFQTLLTNNWEATNGISNSESSMLIRRSRLKFDGYAFSPKLVYKVELGLSNRDQAGASPYTSNSPRYILDAVVKWNFSGNFVLWVGQTKLPGNRERIISSGDLQMVDRSLLNSRFTIDRDIGIQLRHKTKLSNKFLMKEIFSISQGEGRNITTGNEGGYQFTGKVELLPFGNFSSKGDYKGGDLQFEKNSKLSFAVGYDLNMDAVKTRSNQGTYMNIDTGLYQTDISTIFIDAIYKYKGFSLMAEYANRNADNPFAKNSDGTLTGDIVQVGSGLNLQSGYLLSKTLEVSARYTNISLDRNITKKGAENQYTLGVSKYIAGHKLKVQTDLSYTDIGFKENNLMYRLQLDIHF